MVLIWKMGTGLVIFFCNLSQNTCFVYIFWTGLSLERGVYVMARRRKWTNKNMEKKIIWREWTNGSIHRLFLRGKLVIFNNFWTCLIFPQTSGEVSRIYPFFWLNIHDINCDCGAWIIKNQMRFQGILFE